MLKRLTLLLPLFLLLLVVACEDGPGPATTALPPAGTPQSGAQQPAASAPATATTPPTPTSVPPTPTPPLAASVNGEPVYLATYEEELVRQEQGQALVLPGSVTSDEQDDLRTRVLDMLIEQVLIEQAATEYGISITPQRVDEEVEALRQQGTDTGGEGSFEQWLAANQWTEETFREALAYQMLVEQVSTLVTANVPEAVTQVRARYLQVDDLALAQSLRSQLVGEGTDGIAGFSDLAREYSLDRSTAENGGDLGYFARGMLLVPEIEEAAFALEPGEVSDVINATVPGGEQTTYYLVQVVDVDPERPLEPQFRAQLLEERFDQWLAEQWAQAEIVRFVET